MLAHIAVAKPWLVGESDHRILSLLPNLGKFDASSAQELLSAISHDSGNVVNKLAH